MLRSAGVDRRHGKSSGLAAIGALLAAAALCGCSEGRGDVPEATGEVSEAVLGPTCSSASQTHCWASYSGPNYLTFDIGPGFTCAVSTLNSRAVDCYTPSGTSSLRLGWGQSGSDNGLAPAAVKSIALGHPDAVLWPSGGATQTSVALLTTDNAVWFTSGDATQPFYSGTNFSVIGSQVAPVDNSNNPICLSKIAYINMPAAVGSRTDLIGLSCSGSTNPNQIYVLQANGAQDAWFPGSLVAPWNSLSTQMSWVDISHTGNLSGVSGERGAYLLATDGSVVHIGTGAVGNGLTIVWDPPATLPALVVPGFAGAKPIAVGGPFVITNAGGMCATVGAPCSGDDYRFYRHDASTNAWVVMNSGTPWVPASSDELGDGLPYRQIVDGSAFLGRTSEFGVWHYFNRYYMWTGL